MKNDLKAFLDEMKTVRSRSTHLTYGYLLNPFDAWLKENKKSLGSCTYNDIYAYLSDNKKWSNQTKSSFLMVVKQFFKWYRARIPMGVSTSDLKIAFADKQRADQIVDMKSPTSLKKVEEKRQMALSREELRTLLAAAKDPADYAAIYLLAYFGMRKSELASLKSKDINFEKGELKVATAKTYAIRRLYFNSYVGLLLREFVKTDVSSASFFNNLLYKYSTELGIALFPHMLRHTFNTEMKRSLKGEASYETIVKVLMGHTTQDMGERYTEISVQELKKAMINLHYMNGLPKRQLG